MEHLSGIQFECTGAVDKDGDAWSILLVLRGRGGRQRVDYVSNWLRDLVREHCNFREGPIGVQ
jgi:hypothetical protein